jgi:poly(ADP-ribose) glycohydrolase ARH3
MSELVQRASAIAGTMYGAAIGDALGSAFEFLGAEAIEEVLGEPFVWRYMSPVPGSLLDEREPGWPTDDTAMALSVARTIAAGSDFSAAAFANGFLQDLDRNNGRFGRMFWDGGPGIATTGALERLRRGAEPSTCGLLDDGGNGAAMRAHPIGTIRDRRDVLEIAKTQALVTHGHPAAVAAAQAVAVLVHDALAGLETTIQPPAGIDDPAFLTAWVDAHRGIRRRMERLPAHLLSAQMSGWATVATAHAISYIYQDEPKRAFAAAAASGGDTDTVASIVGALVGARCGVEALEPDWLEGLKPRGEVQQAVDLLVARSG